MTSAAKNMCAYSSLHHGEWRILNIRDLAKNIKNNCLCYCCIFGICTTIKLSVVSFYTLHVCIW